MVGVLVDPGLCGGCTVSTQDCVVGVLIDPGLWWEYRLTQDCVIRVLVDPGLCGGCTVSTHDCVVGVLIDPGLCGGSTG